MQRHQIVQKNHLMMAVASATTVIVTNRVSTSAEPCYAAASREDARGWSARGT